MAMDNDMRRMQQEAIHRVQEMQNRAQQKLNGTPGAGASPNAPHGGLPPAQQQPEEPMHHAPPGPEQHPEHHPEHHPEQHGEGAQHNHQPEHGGGALPAGLEGLLSQGPGKDVFQFLMKDSERTLIMILLLLLFTEKADMSVIFSLLYLIL